MRCTVTVTDSGGLTDSQDLTVTVTNGTKCPEITSDGGGATATVSVAENMTAVTDVQFVGCGWRPRMVRG